MTKLALARMQNGRARFFAGRFHTRHPVIGCFKPYVTGAPGRAKGYDDKIVAEAVASYLNFLDIIHTGKQTLPWRVMPLPESRK